MVQFSHAEKPEDLRVNDMRRKYGFTEMSMSYDGIIPAPKIEDGGGG